MAQEIGIILSLEGVQKFTANFTEAINKIGGFAGIVDEVTKRIAGLQRELQGTDNENLINKFKLEDSILKLGSAKVALDSLGGTLRQVNKDIASSSEPKTFIELAKAIGLTTEQAQQFLAEFTQVDDASKNAAKGLDEAAQKAAQTGSALQSISLSDVESIDFETLTANMQKLAAGLGALGEVASKYQGAIAADIFNLVNQFNKVNPGKIEEISNQIGAIVDFFKGLAKETEGVNLSKFSEIIEPILVLSTVKLGPIKQTLKTEKEFAKFFTVLGTLKPAMIKNFDNLVITLLKIETLDIPDNVAKSLVELTKSLSGFVKRISGKFVADNIDITIQAFDKFIDVVARLGTNSANPAEDALYDLYTKFNLLTNVIGPLANLVAAFGTSFQPMVENISSLKTSLTQIAKVSESDLKTALETNINALVNFAAALTKGVPDVDQFVANLKSLTDGLRNFADAVTSIAGRDSIKKFASQVGTLVGAFNRLAKELDVKVFLDTLTPFTQQLRDLAIVITELKKSVGKGTIKVLADTELEKEKQVTQALKNTGKSLDDQNKKLKANEKALAKAAEAAARVVEKQKELNAQYAIDTLTKSNNRIDNYIGNLIKLRREAKLTKTELIKEFGQNITTQLSVKIQVFGIQAFTRLISLLTLGPVKIVILLTKAFFGLASIISKLGITTTINAIIRFGQAIGNVIGKVIGLAKALGMLVFNSVVRDISKLFNIIKVLLAPVRLLLNIFLSIAKGIVYLTKNLFGLVNVFRLLLAPINALIGLMSKLNSLFAGGRKTKGPSVDTGSSVESFKQLDAAATKTYDNIDRESNKVVTSQNELQSEFKETALASKQVDTVRQSLTGLQKVADTINISKTFVFGDNISKLLIGVAALTVSFKALQKVGQLLTQTFQRFSYEVRNIVKDAFDASAEYERLQLTLQSLQKRELTKSGEISPFNVDNVGQQLETLKSAFGGANFGNAIRQQSEESAKGMELVRDRAEELLQWMRALAIQSPFNLEDVANTFKLAQTYGFTTEEAKILTQSVTDLAAATGQTGEVGEGIIRALGQIRANSRLAKEELNQLAERGVPAIEYLADALTEGDSAALLEAVTDGAVSAEVAVKVLSDAIQRDFGGAAALQTQTLSGLLATIQDLRRNILRELATPIFDIFKPLVAQFASLDSINDLLITAARYGQILADKVAVGVTFVVQALATMKVFFEAIPDSVKENIKQFVKFIATTAAVSVALFGLITVLTKGSLIFFALVNPISALIVVLFKFRESVFNVFKAVNAAFQTFINAVNNMYNAIKPGLDLVYNGFTQLLNRISTLLTSFVNTVFTYGANIGISFANGIASAYNYILQQLYAFADLIAYWLAPGSPPRILPDIDEWGTAAANEFLGGFSEADFSAIEDFGSTIEDLIKALELPEGTIDVNDIQKDYAQLLDSFSSGDISDSAIQTFFSEIRKETGAVSEDFINVASQYVALAAEQARLNAATEKYNQQLDETNSQLDQLDQRNTILDQKQQLEELTRILNNRYSTAEAKERAELQRKKILAEQAKAEIENQQKNVDAQKENIDLLKKRIGLDAAQSEDGATTGGGSAGGSDAAEKVKKLKEEAGKLGEGLETALTPLTNIRDTLAEIEPPKVNFAEIFKKATEDAKKKVDELKQSFTQLGATLNIVKVAALGVTAALFAPTIIRNVTALASGVSALTKALAPIALIGLGGAAVIGLLAGGLLLLAAVKPEALTNIGNALLTFGVNAWTAIQLIGTNIKDNIKKNILDPFNEAFAVEDPLFDERTFAQRILDGVIASLNTSGTAILTAVQTFIADNIVAPFSGGFSSGEGTSLKDSILNGLRSVFAPLGTSILAMIGLYIDVEKIKAAFKEKISEPFKDGYAYLPEVITSSDLQEKIEEGLKSVIDKLEIKVNIFKALKIETSFEGSTILADIKKAFDEITASLPTGVFNFLNNLFKRFSDNLKEADLANRLISLAASLAVLARNAMVVVGAIVTVIGYLLAGAFAEIPTIFGGIILAIDGLIGAVNSVVDVFKAVFGGDILAKEARKAFGDNLLKIFKGVEEVFRGLVQFLITVLYPVFVIIFAAINKVLEKLGVDGRVNVDNFVEGVRSAVDRLSTITTDAIEKWNAAVEGFKDFIEPYAKAVQDAISGFILSFFIGVARIRAGITSFGDTIKKAKDDIVDTVKALKTGFKENFDEIKTNLTNAGFFARINALKNAWTTFKDSVVTAKDDLSSAMTALKDSFVDNFATIKDNIVAAGFVENINTIKDSLTAFGDAAVEFGNLVINDPFALLLITVDGIITGPEKITQAILNFINSVTGLELPNPFTALKTSLDALPTLIDELQAKFDGFKTWLSGITLPNPLATLQEGIENLGNRLGFGKEEGEATGEAIASGVQTGLDNSEIKINTNVVRGDVAEFTTLGETYGKPIAEGAVKGYEDETNSETTKSAIRRGGENILGAVTNFFGIKSPSTLMQDEVGIPIAEGIIEGIELGITDDKFVPAGDAITASFTNYSDQQGPELGKSFAANIIDGMREALSTLDLNSAVAEGTGDESASPLQNILTLDTATTAGLLEKFTLLFSQIMEALENFVEEFNEEFATFMELMLESLEEHVETVVEIVEDTFATIIEMLVAFAIRVIQILEKLMSDIERIMRKFEQIMRDAAKAGIDAFIEALEDFGERVKNKLIEQIDLILEELKTKFFDTGKELGKKMVDGIIEAIVNALPDLTAAGESAAAAVEAGVKKGSDIASPSKVMKRLGAFMMDGLKAGILGNTSDLTASALNVVNNMTQTLQDETTKLDISLELPVKLKYDGIKDSLPALTQDVNISSSGIRSGIAAMQSSANASIINNNQSYTMNVTVRQDQVADVRRNFNKMQQLRI